MDCGGVNLDSDDVETAARELPMVDDDSEPAPVNCTTPAAGADAHIFSGWEHSGVCYRGLAIQQNVNPKLSFFPAGDMEPSNLKLFPGLFFTDFVKATIIPQKNMGLSGQDE